MKVHIFLILNTVTTGFTHVTAPITQWPQIVCEAEIIDYVLRHTTASLLLKTQLWEVPTLNKALANHRLGTICC
jgi:hypothetical protein